MKVLYKYIDMRLVFFCSNNVDRGTSSASSLAKCSLLQDSTLLRLLWRYAMGSRQTGTEVRWYVLMRYFLECYGICKWDFDLQMCEVWWYVSMRYFLECYGMIVLMRYSLECHGMCSWDFDLQMREVWCYVLMRFWLAKAWSLIVCVNYNEIFCNKYLKCGGIY